MANQTAGWIAVWVGTAQVGVVEAPPRYTVYSAYYRPTRRVLLPHPSDAAMWDACKAPCVRSHYPQDAASRDRGDD